MTDRAGEHESEQEMNQRRQWASAFEKVKLNKDDYQIGFSRSSGPGGQNVNKVNTKVSLRLDLKQAVTKAPDTLPPSHPKKWLTPEVVECLAGHSHYYVESDHSLLVTSTQYRTQQANLVDALEKLHKHVLKLGSKNIVGQTSPEQKARVEALQDAEARRKKIMKDKRSDVKSGRGFKG